MRPMILLFSLLALLLMASTSEACPTCKLALEEGPDHSQQGYAYSIMFMMAMPFTIALGWTIFIVRCIRQQKCRPDFQSDAFTFRSPDF